MVYYIKKLLLILLSLISVVASPVAGDFMAAFAPVDAETVRLDFAAIADVHMTDEDVRSEMLRLGLYDMENAAYPLDALVFAGDNTDHGYLEQYDLLYGTMSQYTPAKNIIIGEGNHDTWTESEGYNLARDYFIEYTNKITGLGIENVYYTTEVNNYHFVVLGSEDSRTSAYISDEQLVWLEDTMEEASKDGLPIFVVSHWPINGTHGLPETWGDDEPEPADGGFGDQSAQIEAILKSYKNVFLISGHIHDGFTNELTEGLYEYQSVETYGSFHSVNLPSYMYACANFNGTVSNGTGYVFEVYDDKVIIRGRGFSAGDWYTLYTYTIPLA